jgi:hypothetical protein
MPRGHRLNCFFSWFLLQLAPSWKLRTRMAGAETRSSGVKAAIASPLGPPRPRGELVADGCGPGDPATRPLGRLVWWRATPQTARLLLRAPRNEQHQHHEHHRASQQPQQAVAPITHLDLRPSSPAGRAEDQSTKSRTACLRRSAAHSSTFRGLEGWLKARDTIKRPPGAACQ